MKLLCLCHVYEDVYEAYLKKWTTNYKVRSTDIIYLSYLNIERLLLGPESK